jgi:hypothetical protein
MRGAVDLLVPLLGIAGTLAVIGASSRRRSSTPLPAPDISRCTWAVPNPIPIDVVRRAREIQAIGAPLGTEYVEELGGCMYKFRREMRGPNKEIPYWHPGVGVRLAVACKRARARARALARPPRAPYVPHGVPHAAEAAVVPPGARPPPAPPHVVIRAPAPPHAPAPLHAFLPLHIAPLMARKPGTIAQEAGIKHPTPSEIAEAMVKHSQALLQGVLTQQAAWLHAHPRPRANAQPADVAAWFRGAGGSLVHWYPEWNWKVIHKGPPALPGLVSALAPALSSMFEPGEAIAQVQLGPHDGVTWYVHPNGAWSYHHVWGEDWTQAIGDAVKAVGNAVSSAAHVVGDVLKLVQAVASFVPGVGQIVNEVVAAAETALDALSGANALQIALDSAYHAALAAVPGAEALAPILDPVVSMLRTIAGGKQAITKAVMSSMLADVPTSPGFGDINPRSVATTLATWLASKVGLAS